MRGGAAPRSGWTALAALATLPVPAGAERPDPAEACRITATPLVFGRYDPQSPGPTDSTADVTITCNRADSAPREVTLAAGSGNAVVAAERMLTSGPNRLAYNLYSDPARQQIWGSDSDGHAAINLSVDPSEPRRIVIYGRIAARQNVAAGSYADTVLVTLVF